MLPSLELQLLAALASLPSSFWTMSTACEASRIRAAAEGARLPASGEAACPPAGDKTACASDEAAPARLLGREKYIFFFLHAGPTCHRDEGKFGVVPNIFPDLRSTL
jgi:hypothetical protein